MTPQNQQKPCYTALVVPPQSAPGASIQPKRCMQLYAIAQTLLHWLVMKPELTVKQQVDRFGNVIWYIYDPITEQSAHCASEKEARIWIEKRFHHSRVIDSCISNGFYRHQSRLLR